MIALGIQLWKFLELHVRDVSKKQNPLRPLWRGKTDLSISSRVCFPVLPLTQQLKSYGGISNSQHAYFTQLHWQLLGLSQQAAN